MNIFWRPTLFSQIMVIVYIYIKYNLRNCLLISPCSEEFLAEYMKLRVEFHCFHWLGQYLMITYNLELFLVGYNKRLNLEIIHL